MLRVAVTSPEASACQESRAWKRGRICAWLRHATLIFELVVDGEGLDPTLFPEPCFHPKASAAREP